MLRDMRVERGRAGWKYESRKGERARSGAGESSKEEIVGR